MSFSAIDILAEFVESAGAFSPMQREFDYAAFVCGRRRWDTDEERERNRKRYAERRSGHFSRVAQLRRARAAREQKRIARTREALAAIRARRTI